MANPRWTIELLGPLVVRQGEQEPIKFRTRETAALLACLACNPERPILRDDLILRLWPTLKNVEEGRNRFRIALSALKDQLKTPDDPNSVVVADRRQVQLKPGSVATDRAAFDALLSRAGTETDDTTRADLLRQAVALHRGEFLPGYDADWAEQERNQIREGYIEALKSLVLLNAQARQVHTALDYAHRLLQADPLSEDTYQFLIQLYKAAGRPAAALRQYRELERALETTIGARPSPRSQSLIAQIAPRAAKAGLNGTSGGNGNGNSNRSGGGAVAILNPKGDAPFSSSPDPFSTTLPVPNWSRPRTRCFGREDDESRLLEIIDDAETRLITITGFAGTGKTRLALSVADRLFAELAGAVWFVPLASLREPQNIADEIAAAMNLPRTRTCDPVPQIVAALHERPALLILDNFEHLGGEAAALVSDLLDAVPTLRCLVTSRQRLYLSGEREVVLFPLAVPLAPGSPERLLEFGSVQLFVERAQSVRPDFNLHAKNAEAVAQLCRHLEGLPLALELAAVYAQTLTPAQILARLTPRLAFLDRNRQKDAPPRHASLRVALQWSYALLEPDVQRVFARLAIFQRGWNIEAAEAVCQTLDALEILTQLREKSLLQTAEVGEEMRYALLETLREFADENLPDDERQTAQQSHADYYLQYAEAAAPLLNGPDGAEWLQRLAADRDNFRAALQFLRPDPERCLRLAAALWRFWYVRGHYTEGLQWLAPALEADSVAPQVRMNALRGAGNLAYDLGQLEQAETFYHCLCRLAKQEGDHEALAIALGSMGNVMLDRQQPALAYDYCQQALRHFLASGLTYSAGITHANLARLDMEAGRYPEAAAGYDHALPVFRQHSDKPNIAKALNNLACLALYCNDEAAARVYLEEAYSLVRELDDQYALSQTLANYVTLHLRQNRLDLAVQLLAARDALLQRLNVRLTPASLARHQEDVSALAADLSNHKYHDAYTRGYSLGPDQIDALLASPSRQPVLR